MTVGALRPKGDDDLRPVAAETAHDVAQEALPDSLDFLDFFQRPVRVVEGFQERDAQFARSVAELKLPDVRQGAEVARRPAIPEPGAAARHGDQADGRPLGAIARDRRGAPETLVVRVRHHDHQALAVAAHSEPV